MWLLDRFQEVALPLCYAVSIRRPVLFIGFIEAMDLRRLATIPPHRNIIQITSTEYNEKQDTLTQLPILFQGESTNLITPRLTIITSNIPKKFLSSFFELSYGWVVSTLKKPDTIPENVVAFDLRTRTFINGDVSELTSHYFQRLLAEVKTQDLEILLQASLRLLAAKAQSLAHLVNVNTDVDCIFKLLNFSSTSELNLCIEICQADFLLDISKFHKYAAEKLKTYPPQPENKELQKLRQEVTRLNQETIHVDDIRTMLSGITDILVARGIPIELLTKTFNNALREWLPS